MQPRGQSLGNQNSGACRVSTAQTSGGKTTIYASWNGATNVYSWRVLAGKDSKHLATVATGGHTGFETSIPLKSSYGAYQVVALGARSLSIAMTFLTSGDAASRIVRARPIP